MARTYTYDQHGGIGAHDDELDAWASYIKDGPEWTELQRQADAGEITIAPYAPSLVYTVEHTFEGRVRTTDSTPTEVYRLTLQPQTGYAGTCTVIGVDVGNGNVKVIRLSFAVKRLNGGALAIGAPATVASHGDSNTGNWTIAPALDGNDAVLNVDGVNGRTIDWHVNGTIQSFAPAGA